MASLQDTNLQGTTAPTLQLPAGTTAQRPATPSEGMIRWNTDLGYAECFMHNEWKDVRSGNYNVLCYLPMYGDSASNSDITCRVSGVVGTLRGTYTRNNSVGSQTGLYVNSGCLDFQNTFLQRGLAGAPYWTVEWWCYHTGGNSGGTASTMLEMTNYPSGILYRGNANSAAADHYWRGSPISWGNYGTANQWNHYALVGLGTTIRVFINGAQVADTGGTPARSNFGDPYHVATTGNTLNMLRIGASNHTGDAPGVQSIIGTFRKFKVSSIAKYASAFTPSSVYPL